MHEIVMEITLLIMEYHGIVFLNFCGNPVRAIQDFDQPCTLCISAIYKTCLMFKKHNSFNLFNIFANLYFHLVSVSLRKQEQQIK